MWMENTGKKIEEKHVMYVMWTMDHGWRTLGKKRYLEWNLWQRKQDVDFFSCLQWIVIHEDLRLLPVTGHA